MTGISVKQAPTLSARDRSCWSGRGGFTLIELLVVIAIIAILAAILFPVFAQARAKARATSCLSNIKQLTLGMNMYSQDYDEAYPTWQWDLSYSGGSKTPNNGTSVWWNAIYPYVKNAQIYVCPDNKYDVETKDDGAWGWFTPNSNAATFSANTNINIALATVCIGYGSSEPLTYLYPRIASLQRPAETLLVSDCWTTLTGWTPHWDQYSPTNANGWNYERILRVAYPNGYDQPWWGSANNDGPFDPAWDAYARHSNGNNIGYADGHAKHLPASATTIQLYGLPR